MRTDSEQFSLILISPNVSEKMGGEALKALQIYQEYERRGLRVHQITHERVKAELQLKFPRMNVSYMKDTFLQKLAYRVGLLNSSLAVFSGAIIAVMFQWKASRLAREILKSEPNTIVHYSSPISPVLPYFDIEDASVVIGPLNGNIYYPSAFRVREPAAERLRRRLHNGLQWFQRFVPSGKRKARALLIAGGIRTSDSLCMAGCREEKFVETLDSGIPDEFLNRSRITHPGQNNRVLHIGRLVKCKGTDLAIKALRQTHEQVHLDVIGGGPEKENLVRLAKSLRLEDRVTFINWIDRERLPEVFAGYRAMVLPSLAEANGIVVQEAMALGLPVIALNWGGPARLIVPDAGILVEPLGEEYVVAELAKAMDRLAKDSETAEEMSIKGRYRAVEARFSWTAVVDGWLELFDDLIMHGKASEKRTSTG